MAEAKAGAALDIRDLTVRYFGRDDDALRGVSLAVEGGSFVTIAGRNGAGKSTLALVAGGLMPRIVRADVGGRVVIDGEVVVDGGEPQPGGASRQARLGASHRAGMVFPNPGNQLSGTKTSVREELAFGLENLGIPRDEMDGRIDEVLDSLGIDGLAERAPYALSGGEQQRVAIASIVAMGLPVLVLDEPTAQLDPLATITVADLLVRLAADGIAVLAAEHAADVLGRSARTVLLADGRVIADGLPGETLRPDLAATAGTAAPTIVELAAAAGVPAAGAFDERLIAEALGAARTAPTTGAAAAQPALTWDPIRSQPPAAVEIEALVHRYDTGLEAVRGVSLRIGAGEAVAIVGQNGSGKTTLVKHLNGLLRPTSGSVTVGGVDMGTRAVHRAADLVGFVFQDPDDQLFSRTVDRELRFGPRNLGLGDAETKRLVAAAMDVIGLAADHGTNPYDLNVSARKLVALGSVLATDPGLLVLDEPTTGQDSPGIGRIGAIVDALHAIGRTVVAITHDMEFAAKHFGRIIVMRHGEVIVDGPPSRIFLPAQAPLLESTGLRPPPAARIAGRLGLETVPRDAAELLALLASPRG
jgi:energy-coupling factor transport system ATP-binding protein